MVNMAAALAFLTVAVGIVAQVYGSHDWTIAATLHANGDP
jgi:hypothetical protein